MKWGFAALCAAMFIWLSVTPSAHAEEPFAVNAGIDAQYRDLINQAPINEQAGIIHLQQAWLRQRIHCGTDTACRTEVDDAQTARLNSLRVDLRAFADDPPQISAALRFRRTGICDHCDLSRADLSHIAPANNFIGDDELCSVTARADGNFDGAHLDHADFTSCESKRDSRIAAISFVGANLRWADLTSSIFRVADFRGANLSGARLNGATLFRVDMTGANLRRAILIGAKSPREAMHGFGTSFANANMRNASLGGAQLYADFEGADLQGADLTGAQLSGFTVGGRGANRDARHYSPGVLNADGKPASRPRFRGKVNLTDADLSDGSFFGQTHMTPGGFSGAILCRTLLPDGTLSDRDCR